MNEGKVPSDILSKIVYTNLGVKRDEVLVHSGIGEDCSIIDFGEYVAVLSTDPITAANNLSGYLSVIISCNDIASCGANPIGVLETILLPIKTEEKVLHNIMNEVNKAANELNIEVLGGHSEVTSTVNKPIICTTAIGIAKKNEYIKTGGAKINDDVIVTKAIGFEGTSIIAHDFFDILKKHYPLEFIDKSKDFIKKISVIDDGLIAAKNGASAMHDITEGGLLGAAFEIAEASNKGIEIYYSTIPIKYETKEICRFFNIDPLKLISSGSMLITSPNGEKIVNALKENNIEATIIGKITDCGNYLIYDNKKIEITPPERDEIYAITDIRNNP
ncbi:AIR synthase family protein [Thermoanaerobacterium sp. RBIITD]|uniref:AIR synthase family protein n=1 Tax=Thermoanaerobacterium sp. RBIITD TaxID=1550240 RepID=UPI000BB7DDCA|nr:AIR synthase family protein [Thermoanaerobacterium sp. RBIITD]SNX52641.1 Hydrogenase maturation factor [Thermoanaerobacterium sp. RBIITD]